MIFDSLFGPPPERDAETARRLGYAAGCALLFLFAAHAFCWFNLSYSGDAMMIDPTKGRAAQIGGGQFLLPLYWGVRGNLSAPLLVGLLSCLYLSLSTALIAQMLGMRNRCEIALVAGLLCCNSSVTAINAAQLHIADAYFLALLLGVLGAALCRRAKLGFLPAAGLFAAAAALEPCMAGVGAGLLVLSGLLDALEGRRARVVHGALSFALALPLHAAGYALFTRRYGLDWEAALQAPLGFGDGGLALVRAYVYPIVKAALPQTAHPALCAAATIALLIGGLAALILGVLRVSGKGRGQAIALALLLPIAVNLPVFAAGRPEKTSETLAFVLLPVAAVALIFSVFRRAGVRRAGVCRAGVCRAAAALCAALFTSAVVFSNQVYLKKNLETQATLSVMTRVIDRMERTEGYEVGATPVALLGSLEDSILAVSKQGFEHLESFDAARNRYAPVTVEDYTWYLWEIMGYPCNLVSYFESEQMARREDVRAMPAFPAQGCCKMVDGVMVVKLSEELH